MKEITSKKALEVELSKLRGFENAKVSAEQYATPSSIAAEILWKAYLNGNIEGKVIVDLGSGTGTLGIGCLLLGANKVVFVDKDKEAMKACEENTKIIEREDSSEDSRAEFINEDASEYNGKADIVVMNPPFGTRKRHADKDFLEIAFKIADLTYTFHKTSTLSHIMQLAEKNNFLVLERFDFDFMLKNTMKHHRKEKKYIKVSCLVLSTRK